MLASALLALALSVPACVSVAPDATLEAAPRGAIGLVVPDQGPRTSERRARESLVRGRVVNSLRDELPAGERLLGICPRSDWVVGIPAGGEQPNDRRYPVAVVGHDGLLASDSTRIPGLVSIADVARGRVRVEAHEDPTGYLRRLDERIRDNGTARLPAALLVALVVSALALLRPAAAVSALASATLANLVLGVLGLSEPWLTIPLLAAGAAAGLLVRPTALLLAGTLIAHLLVLAVDPPAVALSPLGPTQNSRFYGVSNLLETLLVPVALAAAWRAGRRWLVPFGALAVVTVAGSRFGADVGGGAVLLAGFAVLALGLLRRRDALLAAGALGGAAVLGLVLGPATHLHDAELSAALADRVALTWERATAGRGVALATAAALALFALLVLRGARHALPLAFASAVVVSLVVNDSPPEVAAGGAVGYLALERWVARDAPRASVRSGA